MKRLIPILILFAAASASAQQTVSLGSVAGIDATTSLRNVTIDMTHPANANGQVNTAYIRWTNNGPCTGQVKLKVVRLDMINGVINVVADRGPFTVTNGANKVTVTPPIDVVAGDLLVTAPTNDTCGAAAAAHSDYGDFVLTTNVDFSSGRAISGFNLNRETRPLVQLTNSDAQLTGVIPAVGATAGSFGSFFRTSLQLSNPTGVHSFVRVVFHQANHPADGSDPAKTFTLSPFTTSTHNDIVTEMGLSGLGSLDVTTTNGPPPVVTARVYTDNGPDAGTFGFYEDLVAPSQALHGGDAASFTLPGDTANFRVNVGVRSLGSGANFSVQYYEPSGGAIQGQTLFKSYAANYFEQVGISAFLGTNLILNGGLVVIRVISGDAIVYFSTTDNRTNDTSATILKQQS